MTTEKEILQSIRRFESLGDTYDRMLFLFNIGKNECLRYDHLGKYFAYLCETYIPLLKQMEEAESFEICIQLRDFIHREKYRIVNLVDEDALKVIEAELDEMYAYIDDLYNNVPVEC